MTPPADLPLDTADAMLELNQLEAVSCLIKAELDALHALFEGIKTLINTLFKTLEALVHNGGKVFDRHACFHWEYPFLPPLSHAQKVRFSGWGVNPKDKKH